MKFLKKTMLENGVRFTLGNGELLELSLDQLSEDMTRKLALHGLSQKIGDGASGFSKAQDFAGAMAEMMSIRDGLLAGDWARRAVSGTRDLVLALAEATGKPEADCEQAIDRLSEDGMKRLKGDSRIKAIVKRLQAERAKAAAKSAPKLDLNEMFG